MTQRRKPFFSSLQIRFLRSALLAALGLSATACSTLPKIPGWSGLPRIKIDVVDGQMDARLNEQLPDLPTYWDEIGQQSGGTQINWAGLFNDPLLKSYIDKALAENRNLIISAANIRRAEALVVQSRAGRMPSLSYSFGADRQGLVKGGDSFAAFAPGLSGGWEPDLWGRVKSGEYAALANIDAAKADYEGARQSIAANVARIYFQIIQARVNSRIAQETVTALSENMRIVNAQYQNGAVSGQEPALTQSDMATARQSLIASKNSIAQLTRALELLLNDYPDYELTTASDFPPIPSLPEAGFPSTLLENRPDIVAAERDVAAAFYSLEQAKVARLPSFSLSGTLGNSSNVFLEALDPTNLAWKAGASLLGPILDGGIIDANIEIAEASQIQALASYRLTALAAFEDVETALANIRTLKESEQELIRAHKSAQEALRIANIRYQAGEISLLDVLSIQNRTFQTESNLASIRQQIFSTFIDLNLALGGHWQ